VKPQEMTVHQVKNSVDAIKFARISARKKMRCLALDWEKFRRTCWGETILKNAIGWREVDKKLARAQIHSEIAEVVKFNLEMFLNMKAAKHQKAERIAL
jgi:hypothetical protein